MGHPAAPQDQAQAHHEAAVVLKFGNSLCYLTKIRTKLTVPVYDALFVETISIKHTIHEVIDTIQCIHDYISLILFAILSKKLFISSCKLQRS